MRSRKLIVSFGVVILIIGLLIGGYFILFFKGEEVFTVGIAAWASNAELDKNIQGFKDGLAEQGFVEGENVAFIIENCETDLEKQREIARDFRLMDVDLVYSLTTPGTLIMKEEVENIPIVFSVVLFPVEVGLIDSLENSGNNLVGTRNYVSVGRQYTQIERVVPDVKNLAFVYREGELNSVVQYDEMKEWLEPKGIEIVEVVAVDLQDMREKLNEIIDDVDGLFLACDTLIGSGGAEIAINFSNIYNKPSFGCNKDSVIKGALLGNVADLYIIGKMAGDQAGLILRGASPSSLQTRTSEKNYLVVNVKVAEEMGIEISKNVLSDASEVFGE